MPDFMFDSLDGISSALPSRFQLLWTKFCCKFTRYFIPALTSHLLHLRIFLKIWFSCNRISLLALINTLSQKRNNLGLCSCLTLGSLTCLALPAWLNTIPSFLFCSHLCPSLFDNPDRHARWVTSGLSFTCLFRLHPSIREGSRSARCLHLTQWHLFDRFVASHPVCLRRSILFLMPFM